MFKFNFSEKIRIALDQWNITDNDVARLHYCGFDYILTDAMEGCTMEEINEMFRELKAHNITTTEHAWVYRTILLASFEIPHVSWLCRKQADGQSFIDKLYPAGEGICARHFEKTLRNILVHEFRGSDERLTRRFKEVMSEPCVPGVAWEEISPYLSWRRFDEVRLAIGRRENFVALMKITCTADPQTMYGRDRHQLEEDIMDINNWPVLDNSSINEFATLLDRKYFDDDMRNNLLRQYSTNSLSGEARYISPSCDVRFFRQAQMTQTIVAV